METHEHDTVPRRAPMIMLASSPDFHLDLYVDLIGRSAVCFSSGRSLNNFRVGNDFLPIDDLGCLDILDTLVMLEKQGYP